MPYSAEMIDNVAADKVVAGKVEITLTKREVVLNWEVVEEIQFENFQQGQTSVGTVTTINRDYNGENINEVIDFTFADTIVLNHNIGNIPIIQVWVEDGQGGYTDASIDIDHEWGNMLTSTINLGQAENGKLVYKYNS